MKIALSPSFSYKINDLKGRGCNKRASSWLSKARRSQYLAVATFSVVSSKSSLPIMLVATILRWYNMIFTFYPRWPPLVLDFWQCMAFVEISAALFHAFHSCTTAVGDWCVLIFNLQLIPCHDTHLLLTYIQLIPVMSSNKVQIHQHKRWKMI